MNDIMKEVIVLMKADGPLAALVSTRVYGAELKRSETDSMPRKCVVVSYAGGVDRADWMELDEPRFDIRSYGETFFEADRVRRACWDIAKKWVRKWSNGVLIHRALRAGGPVQARTPDKDWPFISESWAVLAATNTT